MPNSLPRDVKGVRDRLEGRRLRTIVRIVPEVRVNMELQRGLGPR